MHSSSSFSVATFEAFLRNATTLSDVIAYAPMRRLYVGHDGAAEFVDYAQVVSGGYFSGLGVPPIAGRLIMPADDQPNAEPVAVVSYRYWQGRLGGDPAAVGKVISINRVPVTVIGVTPPSFQGALQVGEAVDLTLPLAAMSRIAPDIADPRNPSFWWLRIMGRLKPNTTIATACAELAPVLRDTARGHLLVMRSPGAPPPDRDHIPLPRLRGQPGGRGLNEARGVYQRSLHLLLGMVSLVLMVACANVALLLLARGTARRREIAVRLALGASRRRIIRQLLIESLVIATLGAALGLLLSHWGSRALIALQPDHLQLEATIDGRVLGFTMLVALATSVLVGLAPALRSSGVELADEFRGGMQTLGLGSRSWLARSMLVLQVALSVVLLVGAGLFTRTLQKLETYDVGFNRDHLLLFEANAAVAGKNPAQAIAEYDAVRDRIAALPGVVNAAYASLFLLGDSNWNTSVNVPGYTPAGPVESLHLNNVGPGYFQTMEIPLLRGRDFTPRDGADAPKVAIVNQAFARRYFGTEDVIGRHFNTQGPNDPMDIEIVGLVRDTQYSHVSLAPGPIGFFPYPQQQVPPNAPRVAGFVVRYRGAEAAMAAAVRTAVREIDPATPVTNLRTQEQQIAELFAHQRLFATLCSLFAALALGLAAIGLYGLMAYAVQRRTGEIGVRMALGALPTQVLRMIIGESLALTMLGLVLGLAGAAAGSRLIASFLFGVTPDDPATYGIVVGLLIATSLIACALPARRATSVSPMDALRAE